MVFLSNVLVCVRSGSSPPRKRPAGSSPAYLKNDPLRTADTPHPLDATPRRNRTDKRKRAKQGERSGTRNGQTAKASLPCERFAGRLSALGRPANSESLHRTVAHERRRELTSAGECG